MPKIPIKRSAADTGKSESSKSESISTRKSGRAQNQLVYGVKYNKDEDCPNCGAKGQIDLVCEHCGEDSY
jgi:hypothetical protein